MFASPADLLAHLLRDQADVLVAIVRDATNRVDAIEDRILTHQRGSRLELGMIGRVLVRLQRLLAPEPAALFRLLNKPPAWLTESDLAERRNSAEELAASVADSVALGERVRLLQKELTANRIQDRRISRRRHCRCWRDAGRAAARQTLTSSIVPPSDDAPARYSPFTPKSRNRNTR